MVRSRAALILVCMSASLNAMAWCSAMGLPKVVLSAAYSEAYRKAASAIPRACAAIPILPKSSVPRLRKAPALGQEPVFLRDEDVVQKHVVCSGGDDAHLLRVLAKRDAFGVHGDYESRPPPGARAKEIMEPATRPFVTHCLWPESL